MISQSSPPMTTNLLHCKAKGYDTLWSSNLETSRFPPLCTVLEKWKFSNLMTLFFKSVNRTIPCCSRKSFKHSAVKKTVKQFSLSLITINSSCSLVRITCTARGRWFGKLLPLMDNNSNAVVRNHGWGKDFDIFLWPIDRQLPWKCEQKERSPQSWPTVVLFRVFVRAYQHFMQNWRTFRANIQPRCGVDLCSTTWET